MSEKVEQPGEKGLLRERVRDRMKAEGIPVGTDDPTLLALGARPLPLTSDERLRRPRWLYRFHAFVASYFWLPCPICGRAFSGWEWSRDGHTVYSANGTSGTGVCSARCAQSGRDHPVS